MPSTEDLIQILEDRPIAYAYAGGIYIVDNTESPPMASDRPQYHIYGAGPIGPQLRNSHAG